MLWWARKQGVKIGIFCALHIYGRQLNRHPHIHLSVTRGGLDIKHGVWHDLFFKKHAEEEIWCSAVTRLLRLSYNLINPGRLPGLGHIRDKKQWQRYLQAQYGRRTQQYRWKMLTQEEMIDRYISPIPVKHFKMVRYYGFLSNRKRGELLPKVYEALEMSARKNRSSPASPR